MKTMMKTAICGLALVTSLSISVITEAGRIPSHMVPLYTYAVRRINCYKTAGGVQQGWIDPWDYVIVSEIRSDGWAKGTYPVGNRRIERWFRIDDLLNKPNFVNQDRMSPSTQVVVYKNYYNSETIGSVYGNEDILVVSDEGTARQVIYKVNSGGYKMGWLPYFNCLEKPRPKPNPTPNPIINPVVRTSPISNGWYKISSVNVMSRALDVADRGTSVGSNIQLWDYGNGNNQKFQVINQNDGYFLLKAGNCDLYLSAANSSGANYTNVQLASKRGDATQLWRVRSAGNGSYYIESKLRNNLSFDCSGAGSANGTNIQLWDYGGGAWQKWKFEQVSAPTIVATEWRMPVNTDDKNYRKWGARRENGQLHVGADYFCNDYKALAVASGVVYKTGYQNANGNFIIIKHSLDGKNVYSFYAHLAGYYVEGGQNVKAGDVIGKIGNTGTGSNGITHIHFALASAPNQTGGYYGYLNFNPRNNKADIFYNPAYVFKNKHLP